MDHMKVIIDQETLNRTIKRMTYEILEMNKGTDDLVILGILTRGVNLARRIADFIESIEGVAIPTGEIDITSYRDDEQKRDVNASKINFSLDNKTVILVDDVLYTGRSVRAALDAIMDYGRPKEIKLATLIDRGHRELPIRSDFVGKNIPTSQKEKVVVMLKERDEKDGVYIKRLD